MLKLKLKLLPLVMLMLLGACNYEPEFAEKEDLLDDELSVILPGDPIVVKPEDPVVVTPDDPVVVIPEDPIDVPEPTYEDAVDSFTQNSSNTINKVDIVWVIDDSASMGDDQKAIAENFDAFINDFLDKKIDFKMGITTTDTKVYNGEFVHKIDLLTAQKAAANEANFIKDFKKNVKVGVGGDWKEKAFQSMNETIHDSYNDGFFREDALLAYIVVTDEPEQSADSVQEIVDDLLAFKGDRKEYLKIYSVHRVFGNSKDDRFTEAARLTEGFTANIKESFYKNLLEIGSTIVDLINSFKLNNVPVNPDKIKVYVEGQELKVGWAYSTKTNAVVFDSNAVPAEGSAVKVEYKYEVK